MQSGCAMMWLSGGRCAGSRLSRLRTSWRSSGLYRSEIGAKVPLIIFSTSAGRFCEGTKFEWWAGVELYPGASVGLLSIVAPSTSSAPGLQRIRALPSGGKPGKPRFQESIV